MFPIWLYNDWFKWYTWGMSKIIIIFEIRNNNKIDKITLNYSSIDYKEIRYLLIVNCHFW
jgi:hypothetical protein